MHKKPAEFLKLGNFGDISYFFEIKILISSTFNLFSFPSHILFLTIFIFFKEICRFVVTEFGKLSDEFDKYKRYIKDQNLSVDRYLG